MSKPSRESIRVAAYHDYRNGNTNASDVARRICQSFGEKTISGITVMRWFVLLREDDTMTLDAFLKAGSTTAASGGGGAKKSSPKAKATPKPKAPRKTAKKNKDADVGEQGARVKAESPTEDECTQEKSTTEHLLVSVSKVVAEQPESAQKKSTAKKAKSAEKKPATPKIEPDHEPLGHVSTECPPTDAPTLTVEEKKPPPKKRVSKKKTGTSAQVTVNPDATVIGQGEQSTAEHQLTDAPIPVTEQKKPLPKKRASKKKAEATAQPKVEPDANTADQNERALAERPLADAPIPTTEQKKPPPKKRVSKKKAESEIVNKKPKLEIETAEVMPVESEPNASENAKPLSNEIKMTPAEDTAAKEMESEKMAVESEANVAAEVPEIEAEVEPAEFNSSVAAETPVIESEVAAMTPDECDANAAEETPVNETEMAATVPVESVESAAAETLHRTRIPRPKVHVPRAKTTRMNSMIVKSLLVPQ